MKKEQTSKIVKLFNDWPRGAVYTIGFFNKNGFSPQLLDRYKSSGWIESVGRGAYKLAGDRVEWYGAVYALQQQLQLGLHTGGKTALELKGYAHYLAAQVNTVYLYGGRGVRLPKWFTEYHWQVNIDYSPTKLFPSEIQNSFSEYQYKDFTIRISSPERAAMEMLYHVPQKQGFSEASLIMENLVTLRPLLTQELLESCNSVKVKRLFLYLAEKHQHEWVQSIKYEKIYLGKGNREIIKNGKLDSKYQIIVPTEVD